VLHILKDRSIKTNLDLEKELLKKFEKKLPQINLFESDITIEKQLREAFRLKNKEIGFSPYLTHKEQEIYD
jgi:hypothetical protein